MKKFDFVNVKTASTPIKTQKPLVNDEEASDVDVYLYRSMIGSLMYLTASRPNIMFAVYVCSRFQVTPKTSYLSVIKRIFRYLKGKPKLGLWYPRVSSIDLEAYLDSNYAGANLDRKSKTGVYHSKTKQIAIRHHFIRDAYEKKLIQVLKIHTDDNVPDLLTKAFDVSRNGDLKWQVAMISMRMKKFYKKTGRKLQFDAKEPVGFDKTKVECYNCHKTGHFARECRTKGNQDSRRRDAWNSGNKDGRRSGKQEDSKALVTIDGEGVDWTNHSEEEEDYALMDCNTLRDRTPGLKKVEAQLVAHQQGQLWYEQKIKFMKIDLDDKTDVLTYHKKLLAEAMKEKEDLKAKVEKWHNSSKNLGKLINTQMSANDKFGLGYGDHRYDGILSYENKVLQSVFKGKESDFENPPLYDRFVTVGGMNAVPPPMTRNYMPSGPDIEIDYSQFTYGPKQTQHCVVFTRQPKVWSDAPIIEEYESDSEDEYVSIPTKEQETPSFANQQVKTPRETVKNHFTHSKNPKVDKKELGYGFTARACFVCGSLNHLIRDCDFHEKRMAKQAELNNRLNMNSSQREIRPIWNNVQRVNKQNQFVPTAVLTRTGKIPVNTARASGTKNVSTARHSFNRHAVLTSAAMKVNTVKPIVNRLVLLGEKGKLLLSPQQVVIGDHKDTTGTMSPNTMDYPHRALQNKGIVDSGCSRHMTGNKAYLAEYHVFYGGPVAFGGVKRTKDETSGILKDFIRQIKNQLNQKVKTIRCDNGTEFKNKDVIEFCGSKGIKREYSNARTPQQNGVAERKNRTLIEAARTMLADSFLPNTFWAEAFDGKSDEGFLVGYSLQSKAFRVYNLETKRVEENLHITFLENKPNVAGKGPTWLFDLDYLTDSMNYQPVRLENQANKHAGPPEANQNAGTEDSIDAGDSEKEDESAKDYFCTANMMNLKGLKGQEKGSNDAAEAPKKKFAQETRYLLLQVGAAKASRTNIVNIVSTPVSTASPYDGLSLSDPTNPEQDDSEIPALEDIYQNPTDGIFTNSSYDDEGAVVDFTNLESVVNISEALEDESWVDAMQEELLQFKIQKVWILVDFPYWKKAIGTKWGYRNKKDERGVFVRNKARLVAQGHRQEEGIDYDKKVYKVVKALYGLHQAPRAWYATLSTFLLKNGYRRGTIDKTLFLKKDKHDIILVQVYVDDIIFGSTKKSWCDEFKALMKSRFQMSSMGELTFFLGLQVKQKADGIFISQDKYVAEILKKFDFVNVKTASTPIETQKPLVKDEEASDVDVHLYKSMIGFPGHSKDSHLSAAKRIFRESTTGVLWISKSNVDYGFNFMNTKFYICIMKAQYAFVKIPADLYQAFDVSRESLGRALDGTEALMLPKLFILWLATVSTDSAELVPMGKVSTAIETLKKNTAKALISLSPTITHSKIMAVLESCPKHNMVAYLEKTDGNAEFHEIIDFLTRSSIHHALTVSPVVSTTFVEQFWTSAKSKIINNVRHITAKVAGKPVSISEASIRSDLLFDDADGIDSLPNQAIFDAIQLMGYEGDLTVLTFNKALFSPQWRHLDAKKKFVMYPRFISIFLDKQLENVPVPLDHFPDEGAPSERPSEAQPTPSPPHPSEAHVETQSDPSPRPSPSTTIPDSIPESSGGNHEGQSSSDKSLSGNEGDMTLKSVYDLCISLCTQSMDEECLIEAKIDRKEILKEKLDTKGVYLGRTRDVVDEEKENAEDVLNTEDVLSIAQQKISTDKEKVSTDRPIVSTDGSKVSTDKEKDSTDRTDEGIDDQTKGGRATQTTKILTSTIFGDDETIAQVLLNMSQAKAVSRENEKGVEFKDIEETERTRPTSTRSLLTLKPLPKIDPKDKGKKKIEEEDESKSESDGIHEAEKKLKQLASDEEMARKYSQLKTKKFEEIQALYEKIKRSDEDFIAIGSAEDERMIKEMNEKGIDSSKNVSVKEEDKEEEGTKKRKSGHIKMIARKKPRKQSDDDSDDEHRKCLKIVTFEATIDSEIMEKKSVIARLNKGDLKIMMESSTEENDQSDFWSNQQDWKIITWRLYEACGVCILELEDGIVIHMLVERRYPLSKELLQRMLDLGLEVERESSVALDLIRFIKQQIDEE
ncbi:putative ribonuclease H-like domain-containing protein [Tanacetum coccineum]|uniref:Ribonuclease H-like domain-containing protein n=1 Tax=Tanacetum coccineum TaxID=301880 RepID=A0ABQ4XT52_9ASTR